MKSDVAERIRDGTFKNLYERQLSANERLVRENLELAASRAALSEETATKIRTLLDYFLPLVELPPDLPQAVADIIAESEERTYAKSSAPEEER